MGTLLLISYLGSFGGIGVLQLPMDMICILPFSIIMLYLSQSVLDRDNHTYISCEMDEVAVT
jgi:hypothetical protein